ncbi:MAG: hypothetical protein C4324_05950 [Blastocatellia bacterium]
MEQDAYSYRTPLVEKMAETERLSHFDADGLSVIERIENGGFLPRRKIGENLFLASSLDETEVLGV